MIFRRVSWSSMSAVPWAAFSRLDRRQRPLLLLRAIAAVWCTPYGQHPCGAHRDFHRQNALKPARCHRRWSPAERLASHHPFVAALSLATRYMPIWNQAILTDFIVEGHFSRHIRRMRTLYAERAEAL